MNELSSFIKIEDGIGVSFLQFGMREGQRAQLLEHLVHMIGTVGTWDCGSGGVGFSFSCARAPVYETVASVWSAHPLRVLVAACSSPTVCLSV